MKKFFLKTYGCKVNQYETQVLREQLLAAGLRETNDGEADFYFLNSCVVTDKSARNCRQFIRKCLNDHPRAKIILCGCYADYQAQEILEIAPQIIICRNNDKANIIQLLNRNDSERLNLALRPIQKITGFKGRTRAFVKVQDGCNNFCSYCVVPYVRGMPQSRRINEIKSEVCQLVDAGYKEMVITGINLGAYGRDFKNGSNLKTLLLELLKMSGIKRLRLSSIEPQYLSSDLIKLIAETNVLCPHLHLPLQSGDDAVLKAMNRNYTANEYLRLCVYAKKMIPDLAITTDIIAGCPQESEKAYRNTLNIASEIGFLRIHVFPFSRRRFTTAYQWKQLLPAVVKERVMILQETAIGLSIKYRQKYLNQKLELLVENRKNGDLRGYTQNFIQVSVVGNKSLQNQIVPVEITKVEVRNTFAKIVSTESAAPSCDP
ncbi:MAG: tRNA (N(6)-L-threonylcarbamoyladenosine(37)-C(2))-methylthiotransferase MtaB [Candidatus Omnitrophota bacterium]